MTDCSLCILSGPYAQTTQDYSSITTVLAIFLECTPPSLSPSLPRFFPEYGLICVVEHQSISDGKSCRRDCACGKFDHNTGKTNGTADTPRLEVGNKFNYFAGIVKKYNIN